MQRNMTITEIARESGVSISTVSRVLNGTASVADDKRARVEATIHKYNYAPNVFARGLVSRHSMTIGVILPDISNPYFSSVFCEIERAAHDAGYSTLLCNTLYHSDIVTPLEEEYIQMMLSKHVDGLIIAGGQQDLVHPSSSYLETLKRAVDTLPTIIIGEKIPGIPCLFLDREKENGISAAMEHLFSLGHRRIAFLGGENNVKITLRRIASYKEALSNLGLPAEDELISLTDYYTQDGYSAANLLLENNVPFTAALAINDNVALGAIRAFHDKGMTVPDDISLISCEYFTTSDFFIPRMTVIDRHSNRFGKMVIQKLLNVINGLEENDNINIAPELLIRESCANL